MRLVILAVAVAAAGAWTAIFLLGVLLWNL